jgi:Putative MetA-pathway of phenol degradation
MKRLTGESVAGQHGAHSVTCRFTIQFVVLWLALSTPSAAWAEEPGDSTEPSCVGSSVISVPSRPTVTSATDTTQCGVVELEYGLERQWPGSGANRDDLSGGLRLGLTHNLDFHWASATFLHVMDGVGDRIGFGDTWLGLRYRFLRQTKHWPSLGLAYQVKVPSASVVLGLGSGQVDHSPSFLVSKDVHPFHIDFNVLPLLAGRPTGSGFDHNVGFALSASAPLTRRFGVVGEGYGYTDLNQSNPAFASTMMGFTYQVGSRLILDTGLDVGVTSGAPRKRVFVGITYAMANVYSWMWSRH